MNFLELRDSVVVIMNDAIRMADLRPGQDDGLPIHSQEFYLARRILIEFAGEDGFGKYYAGVTRHYQHTGRKLFLKGSIIKD